MALTELNPQHITQTKWTKHFTVASDNFTLDEYANKQDEVITVFFNYDTAQITYYANPIQEVYDNIK